MAAAAAAAVEKWRARFRDRVEESESCLLRVYGSLTAALQYVEAPMVARDRIKLALEALGDASSDLSFAMSSMKAAEILALRGGGASPSLPCIRIEELGVQYLAERNAGLKLRDAWEDAKEAYPVVEQSRSHLEAVLLLLDHLGVPDVDDLIQADRRAAVDCIKAAKGNAELGCGRAIAARRDVPGAN
uniref:Uncharacterized protein n=1 Tax=Leersia perrieri TaxID=77586 RepID=A0A0D9UWY7_9ORYZ